MTPRVAVCSLITGPATAGFPQIIIRSRSTSTPTPFLIAAAKPNKNGVPATNDHSGPIVETVATRVLRRESQPSALQRSVAKPVLVARPLPKVLLLHTGGTLGMDAEKSFEMDVDGHRILKAGTGGLYQKQLRPGSLLNNVCVFK